MARVKEISFKGIIKTRSESKNLLINPGDLAIVERDVPRLIILRCPCGCGDDLIINLDNRIGPAWRLYSKSNSHTLYPSYWRDTACNSHFILWNNKIYWFGRDEEFSDDLDISTQNEDLILRALKENEFTHYLDLANECRLDPWECLQACKQLSKKGLSKSKKGRYKDYFKKTKSQSRDFIYRTL